jgi:hypothetical protein
LWVVLVLLVESGVDDISYSIDAHQTFCNGGGKDHLRRVREEEEGRGREEGGKSEGGGRREERGGRRKGGERRGGKEEGQRGGAYLSSPFKKSVDLLKLERK